MTHQPELNGVNGRFAQVNLAPNEQVDLRVQVLPSCCSTISCTACDNLIVQARVAECYAQVSLGDRQ